MRFDFFRRGVLLLALAVFPRAAHAQLQVLHSFNGTDGGESKGSVILSGGVLYGFTAQGGNTDTSHGNGTLFLINEDGTGFNSYYTFSNSTGSQPHHGHMLAFNGSIYRPNLMGAAGGGELFSVSPTGGNYADLHVYQQSTGWQPHSGVILGAGNIFYGLTAKGGDSDKGTVYFYDPATDNHHHFFSFDSSTGYDPHGELIFDSTGQYLLGMNRSGGAHGDGNIFRLNPFAGNVAATYEDLYDLHDHATHAGFQDHGTLLRINTTVYGLTQFGGAGANGTIFSMDETGGSLTLLHSFGDGNVTGDGMQPYGSLTLVNGLLYGMTRNGGDDGLGTIFSLNPDGSGYDVLYSFGNLTGFNPIDDLTASDDGSVLYGLTERGGANDPAGALGYGTIFAFSIPLASPIPEPSSYALLASVVAIGWALLRRRRRSV